MTKKHLWKNGRTTRFHRKLRCRNETGGPRDSSFAPKVPNRIQSQAYAREEWAVNLNQIPSQTISHSGVYEHIFPGIKKQEWNSLKRKTADEVVREARSRCEQIPQTAANFKL